MRFSIEQQCICGAVRPNNEDAIDFGVDADSDFCWIVVADGMGGHKAGEVASGMLVDQVKTAVSALEGHYQQDWVKWIEATFKAANKAIYTTAQASRDKNGMGTTGVIVICYRQQMFVGWVGDSRAYRYRDGQLLALTRDHSAIHYLLDKGSISQQEADQSDSKHLLARAVGSKKEVQVDCVSKTLQSGDILLLSTDGLHDYLPQAVLAGYLACYQPDKNICETLVNLSIAQGSQDNITVAIVKLT